MRWVGEVFDGLGVTGQDREPAFPDGAAFRIEIPSVEGPRVLEAVQRAAEAEGITVNRVSQGSGAMLLRASELVRLPMAGRLRSWRSWTGCGGWLTGSGYGEALFTRSRSCPDGAPGVTEGSVRDGLAGASW